MNPHWIRFVNTCWTHEFYFCLISSLQWFSVDLFFSIILTETIKINMKLFVGILSKFYALTMSFEANQNIFHSLFSSLITHLNLFAQIYSEAQQQKLQNLAESRRVSPLCVWSFESLSHLAAHKSSWNRRKRIAAVFGRTQRDRFLLMLSHRLGRKVWVSAGSSEQGRREGGIKGRDTVCLGRSLGVGEKLFVFWSLSGTLSYRIHHYNRLADTTWYLVGWRPHLQQSVGSALWNTLHTCIIFRLHRV